MSPNMRALGHKRSVDGDDDGVQQKNGNDLAHGRPSTASSAGLADTNLPIG